MKPELDKMGVGLVAIVHEIIDEQVQWVRWAYWGPTVRVGLGSG